MVAATFMLGSLIGGSPAWAALPDEPERSRLGVAGGMSSPEAAVEELLASVRASDPLGLLAVLHPEERYLVDTLYTNSTGAAEAAGAVDVDALLRALHIDVTTDVLTVESLSDRVAWVTTISAHVTATLDVAQVDAAVAADLDESEQGEPFDEFYEPQEDQLGVAAVNEDGQWFVSALYTAAELARRDMELPSQLAAAAPPAPSSAATPEAAVTALTSAVMAKDFSAAASVLTPLEGRLVADYQSTIGAELLDALQPYTLTVEPTDVHVIDQGADWAIVEVDRWRFGASGAGDDALDRVDFMLTVDGLCGELRDWDNDDEDYEVSSACAFEEDSVFNAFKLLADEGWRGPRFVAVSQDGAWSVSLLQTVLQAAAPFTTDVVTLAGVVEFVAVVIDADDDAFYPAATSFLAAGQPPLPVGTSTVPARGNSSVAIFRVGPGATVGVDVGGDFEECFVAVLDEDAGDFVGTFQCDEQSEPIAAPATMLLTTSGEMAFSSIEQLGDVTVTVS